jgi:membrane peptidoglycan carboxypeptidase
MTVSAGMHPARSTDTTHPPSSTEEPQERGHPAVARHTAAKPPSRRAIRKADKEASHVAFDDLLGWDATEPAGPKPSKAGAVIKGLITAAFMGTLAASLTVPLIGAGAITLREASDYWDHLPSELPTQPLPQRSVILAADGSKIAEFYSENRVLVPLSEVPDVVKDALISIEDSRFYEHAGVDVRGTTRALLSNLTSDSTQGGSTLTQQYVKQVLADAATSKKELEAVTSRTSYMRKLREAKLARSLEDRLTKDQILEGYLNIAYFGDGAYGIGTAARHYFDKEVGDLSLAQAALLAGLVKNPTGYDPTDYKSEAIERRNIVLFRMHQLGKISDTEYNRAKNAPLRLRITTPANGCHASKYPFFCQYVKQQLENDPVFGETAEARQQRLFRGGMVIRTTLNPRKQDIAQRAVDTSLGRDNRVAAAAVTVKPGTGEVVSMATNRTFGRSKPGRFDKTELILPVLPAFQPGSNFKPFTLAAALVEGFDPETVVYAPPVYAPSGMNYPSSGFQNSGSSASGNFNAAQAIWRSSNTWFVKLEEQVGVLNVADMAERLGITTLPREGAGAITPRDASLTLGAYEVSPLEMAGAYATFAARGVHCTPVVISSVTGPDGNPINVPDADCHEAIPPSVADTIANIMQGTIDGPDPYRTGKEMSFGRPAAGKTGTTQNNAAVWFSGYTPQFATSVAVMDPRGGFRYPLQNFYAGGQYISRAYGGLVAGPIWRNIMSGIHSRLPVKAFNPPSGLSGYSNVAPDVRGLTLEQAYQVLTKAGFEVTLNKKTAPKDPLLKPDRVFTIDPAPGSLVGLGTSVEITMTAGSNLNVDLSGDEPPPAPDSSEDDDMVDGPTRDTGGGIVTGTKDPNTPGAP